MNSKSVTPFVIFSLNLLFVTTFVLGAKSPPPKISPSTPLTPMISPSTLAPEPTTPPPTTPPSTPPSIPATPPPPPPPPPQLYPRPPSKCQIGLWNLHVCANLLNIVNVSIGPPQTRECCQLIDGLVGLEASVCLCTALKANIFGLINIDLDIPFGIFFNRCGRVRPNYICSR
ncbi:pEARLI1-like lipid transfer protein 2 [Trifolium pratense]|uniref:pEARLI1-like lipid transfer protein 2 n=1 Tax=Trifolium pratense TaxID=57577 RepID=UPI001E692B70|nr:pEARLI1-like lipid transfer protein 2 [Trifolium pratense]